jgi:iron complex transport system substrate-binding protein
MMSRQDASGLRIVSLLPAATEMVCALGLEDQLVGVTHECDYPPAIRGKAIVVRSALSLEGKSAAEIDKAVQASLRESGSLYELDEELLASLSPTHVLAQDLCQVCAASGRAIAEVLNTLPSRPQILWLSPRSLADIEKNLIEVAHAMGQLEEAQKLIVASQFRVRNIRQTVKRSSTRPRVLCLEWTDPYFSCGHWIPEMVEVAGGQEAVGQKGSHSARIEWPRIEACSPEILIVMPCGFSSSEAEGQARYLMQQMLWKELPCVQAGQVFAVDANAYFARPGPRVIDGIELLAHLIHSELCRWDGSKDAFVQVS